MRLVMALLGAFVLLSSNLHSQVTLLGSIAPPHGTTGGVSYAGCWGYVAPDGREYAILGTATGCSIVDITNAASPVEIGHITGATSLWKEVSAYDHYAYCVSDVNGAQGLQIINLANLPNSVSLDTTIFSLGGFSIAQVHTISIHNGFLYLNGTGSGMIIASLADPRRPLYLGRWNTRYTHDSYTRNDTIFAACLQNAANSGLYIINATNKAAPTVIASILYTGAGTHNVWLTKDRRYAITTDEIGSTAKNLKVWNLQNLPTVSTTPAATFSVTPTDVVHNVFIRGDYAYVAWYTAGLRVVNFTNPATPADAGGYDTSTEPPGQYDGMWGCWPFFPSGKIIGSDMQNGLFIFSHSALAARQNTALLAPANGVTLTAPTNITFRWSRAANISADPHYYMLRIFGSGFDTTFRANDTTATFTAINRLDSGTTYTWTVTTRDEFTSKLSQESFQFTYDPPLPIVLQSFSGRYVGGGRVRLNWRTLSEIENYGFEVQKSRNATNSFNTIPNSFIPGYGTTNEPHDYSFTDSGAATGLWYYRLKQINQSGTFWLSEPISVTVTLVGDPTKPTDYALLQNYPNPFNPTTDFGFRIVDFGLVALKVFDIFGKEVATVVNETMQPGNYRLKFDGSNLASGVYFYKLQAGRFTATRKMVLAK
jgi:choice-of-anchor B domain-containing protein